MSRAGVSGPALVCALALLACGAAGAQGLAEEGCGVPVGNVLPICGMQAPEDLEPLPGGRALLVSEFGGLTHGPGRLSVLDLESREVQPVYPENAPRGERHWGDPSCTAEPDARFSPHGIHLTRGPRGRQRLLVVNHGGREAVEMFEVRRTRGAVTLQWRGCVTASPDDFLNDVATLPDGGFLVTVMMKRSDPQGLERAFRGEPTGYVMRWHPRRGWSRLPGSEGSLANGIQTDARGRHAFVAVLGTDQVLKLALPGGERLGAAITGNPDNLSWTASGELLAAGMDAGSEQRSFEACKTGAEPECYAPSHVDRIDPVTMRTEKLFGYGNREMHPATVGLRIGDKLYVGSYMGNRLLEVKLGR